MAAASLQPTGVHLVVAGDPRRRRGLRGLICAALRDGRRPRSAPAGGHPRQPRARRAVSSRRSIRFATQFPAPDTYRAVQDLALEARRGRGHDPASADGQRQDGRCLLWGQHQIELGRADRLVIAMPTRFTSNALALGNAEDGSARRASTTPARGTPGSATANTERPSYELARERHKLARLLATPAHGLHRRPPACSSLTGTREDHHATFFFLANSRRRLRRGGLLRPVRPGEPRRAPRRAPHARRAACS